jgi:hypothetical protein
MIPIADTVVVELHGDLRRDRFLFHAGGAVPISETLRGGKWKKA